MARRKEEVITVKVEPSLLKAMRGISNRSRFVRDAILAALENTCPLCMGTGSLSPDQKTHWEVLQKTHPIRECPECHELRLTCHYNRDDRRRHGPARRRPQ